MVESKSTGRESALWMGYGRGSRYIAGSQDRPAALNVFKLDISIWSDVEGEVPEKCHCNFCLALQLAHLL